MKKILNSMVIAILRGISTDKFGFSIVIALIVGGLTNSIVGLIVGYVFVQIVGQLVLLWEVSDMEGK